MTPTPTNPGAYKRAGSKPATIYAATYRPTELGVTIVRMRQSRDLDRADLATLIGTNWNTVRYWETGRNLPTAPYLCAIATAFECTVDELLKGTAP